MRYTTVGLLLASCDMIDSYDADVVLAVNVAVITMVIYCPVIGIIVVK